MPDLNWFDMKNCLTLSLVLVFDSYKRQALKSHSFGWWHFATYFFSGFWIVPAIYLVRLYLLRTATSKSDSSTCYWYKKLNKLISIDWYLFTPYFSNCLSHEEGRKDVFLLSVLLRQFPLNSFQFLNAGWYKNITHLLAWIISITSWMIHNKIKQSAQFENILLFVHLHSTAQAEPNDTRVWGSRFFSLF